jgi:hypothetical protein
MAIRRVLLDLNRELPITATTDNAPTMTVSNFAIELDCFADDESAAASVTAGRAVGGAGSTFAAGLPAAGTGAVDATPADVLTSEGSGQRDATVDRGVASVP